MANLRNALQYISKGTGEHRELQVHVAKRIQELFPRGGVFSSRGRSKLFTQKRNKTSVCVKITF